MQLGNPMYSHAEDLNGDLDLSIEFIGDYSCQLAIVKFCVSENVQNISSFPYEIFGITDQNTGALESVLQGFLPPNVGPDCLTLSFGSSVIDYGSYEGIVCVVNAAPGITNISEVQNFTPIEAECDLGNNSFIKMNPEVEELDYQDLFYLCEGDEINIGIPDIYSTYLWNTGETVSTISVNEPGDYFLAFKDICNSELIAEFKVLPSPLIGYFSEVNATCPGMDEGRIFIQFQAPDLLGFDFQWSDGIEAATLVEDLAAGDYTLTVSHEGCTDVLNFTVESEAVEPYIVAQSSEVCFGANDGYIQISSQENAHAVIANGTEQQTPFILEDLPAGTYSVTIRDERGCSEDVEIEIPSLDEINLSLPDTIYGVEGDLVDIVLNGNIESDYGLEWESTLPLSCLDCPIPSTNMVDNSIVNLLVTVGECTKEYSTFLRAVEPKLELFIPNVLNPSDLENNTITVFANEVITNVKFQVFDRWGNQLFISDNSKIAIWDGTYGGNRLQSGVYVYGVEVTVESGEIKTEQGTITLVE